MRNIRMKPILFLFMVLLIISSLSMTSAECNSEGSEIIIKFKSLQEDNLEISRYQFPNYKEDDLLRLNEIYVINKGNCKTKEAVLKINFTNPENKEIDHFFCLYQMEIPSLEPNQTYYFYYQNTTIIKFDNTLVPRQNYIDTNFKTYNLCRVALSVSGTWKISLNLISKENGGSAGSYSWGIWENNKIYGSEFKVRSKSEILSLEQQETTIFLTWVTIIVTIILGIVGVLAQFFVVRWEINLKKKEERDSQKSLLNNIYAELDNISNDVKGHKTELSKNIIPSYLLYEPSSKFYLSRLNSQIDNKNTQNLKDLLIKLEQKIKNINQMLNLAQQTNNKIKLTSLISEIKENKFKYHSHLEEIIKSIREEIKKIQ